MNRRPLILFSLCLGAFVISVDVTIVNVALPTLVRRLGASTTQLQWIVDAYSLVSAEREFCSSDLSSSPLGVWPEHYLGRSPISLPHELSWDSERP
jgi:hypothetical protein